MTAKHPARDFACELGVALPVTVAVLFAVLALALAAAATAITANSQSRRDRSVKQAIAAADAGIQVASYRLNKIQPDINQCPVIDPTSGSPQSASGDPWCSTQPVALGDGESAIYRVQSQVGAVAPNARYTRDVVSIGTANGVSRRVEATIAATPRTTPFDDTAVGSNRNLVLRASAAIYEAGCNPPSAWDSGDVAVPSSFCGAIARVGGNVDIGGSTAYMCGRLFMNPLSSPPPDKTYQNTNVPPAGCLPQTTGGLTSPPLATPAHIDRSAPVPVLAPVPVPPNLATNNDNCRLSAPSAFGGGGACSSGDSDTLVRSGGGSTWSPATRSLIVTSGDKLTLKGGTYLFCSLQITGPGGAEIHVVGRANGLPVRIYIDDPANCSGPPPVFEAAFPPNCPPSTSGFGWGSVNVGGSGKLLNDTDDPSKLELLVEGDQSGGAPNTGPADVVNFGGNFGSDKMVIIAPDSCVAMQGTSTANVSAVRADQVSLSGSTAGVTWDDRAARANQSLFPTYRRTRWTECPPSGGTASNPDLGC